MNIKLTTNKLKSLSNNELETLDRLIKDEYKSRGKVSCNGERVNNFTSNKTHSINEQVASLERMFERAWIHG